MSFSSTESGGGLLPSGGRGRAPTGAAPPSATLNPKSLNPNPAILTLQERRWWMSFSSTESGGPFVFWRAGASPHRGRASEPP